MISSKSLIVAKWEFLRFFKWRQQLVSYLLILLVMSAVSGWRYFNDENRQLYRIAVPADMTIANTEQFEFQRPTIELSVQLQQLQTDESWHAVLEPTADSVIIHTRSGRKWLQPLQTVVEQYYRQQAATGMGLTTAQLAALEQPVKIETRYADKTYKGKDTPEKMIALGVLVLLFVGLSTAFGQVLMSITGEKQQRVTEQLYAILTPQQWMDGKVLGHSLSALKAMLTSGLVMVLGLTVVSLVRGKLVDLSWINYGVVLWLVPFALVGVLLCACFMGAIAASIDDPNNSGKSAVMLITWLPMVFTFIIIDSPTGWGMTVLSFLPLTSFAAMPVKMAMVTVPLWQPIVSLLLLLATVYWMRRVAGRVFMRGMQMYGKEPGWADIVRWALSNKKD